VDKVKGRTSAKGTGAQGSAVQEVLDLRMADGQSMSSHINDFVGIFDQLIKEKLMRRMNRSKP